MYNFIYNIYICIEDVEVLIRKVFFRTWSFVQGWLGGWPTKGGAQRGAVVVVTASIFTTCCPVESCTSTWPACRGIAAEG